MQLDRLQRPRRHRQCHEGQVEAALLDAREQAVVLGLLQLDLDRGPGIHIPAQELGQDAGSSALERTHPERPGLAALERVHVGPRGLQPRDDHLGVQQEQPAGLGQLDGPRAAWALDQARANQSLERRDLLTDRRLGVSQGGGGPPERAVLGNRLKRSQVAELNSQPLIRFHNGNDPYFDLCLWTAAPIIHAWDFSWYSS